MASYRFDVENIIPMSADSTNHRWTIVQGVIALMKTAGWSTRGSSTTGTAGTAYSSTPDGVDRWVGQTYTQAVDAGNNFIWNILEHTAGHQVAILFGRGTPNYCHFVVAKNKFETGGAWRNGGSVSATVRPEDITSSPAQDREVVQNDVPSNFLFLSSLLDTYWHAVVRDDGQAIYVVAENSAASESFYSLWGIWKLQDPSSGDSNPWIAASAKGLTSANLGDVVANNNITGRIPTAAQRLYAITRLKIAGNDILGSGNIGNDPFTGNERVSPIGLWTDVAPVHIRFTLPDLCYVPDSWGNRDQFNGRTYTAFGVIGLPWDEVTNTGGTQHDADFIAADIVSTDGGTSSPSALNVGVEVL